MDRFGYDARSVAAILILMAVVMGTIQGGAIRPLAARFGERTLLIAGLLGMGASFALVPYAPTVALLLVPLVLGSAARGIAHPPLLSLVSTAASPESRGAVMGTFQSAASLARIGGPLVAGALYDLSIAGPFLLASALVLAATPLSRPLPATVAEPSEPAPVAD
jgi:MFS family permease